MSRCTVEGCNQAGNRLVYGTTAGALLKLPVCEWHRSQLLNGTLGRKLRPVLFHAGKAA